MAKVLIHFYIVNSGQILELRLDESLSFMEVFKLLGFKENFAVYDANKGIFLKRDIPIANFCIKRYIALELL